MTTLDLNIRANLDEENPMHRRMLKCMDACLEIKESEKVLEADKAYLQALNSTHPDIIKALRSIDKRLMLANQHYAIHECKRLKCLDECRKMEALSKALPDQVEVIKKYIN